jgi:hypothetical protein
MRTCVVLGASCSGNCCYSAVVTYVCVMRTCVVLGVSCSGNCCYSGVVTYVPVMRTCVVLPLVLRCLFCS